MPGDDGWKPVWTRPEKVRDAHCLAKGINEEFWSHVECLWRIATILAVKIIIFYGAIEIIIEHTPLFPLLDLISTGLWIPVS